MTGARLAFVVFFGLVGLGLNLFLVWLSLHASPIAGCASECAEVLASQWSRFLGLPVAGYGALLFGVVLVRARSADWLLGMSLSVLVVGAVWFVVLQLVVLGKLCPWCLAAHAVALVTALCAVGEGVFGVGRWVLAVCTVGVLASAQALGPAPASHRIEEPTLEETVARQFTSPGVRRVSFVDGRKTFYLPDVPFLGRLDAPYVVAELFDYHCQSCREMAGYLDALQRKHSGKVAVVLLPVPLERDCNGEMPAGQPSYKGSCELTRLALAVWRSKPEAFAGFHRALLADPAPNPAAARRLAVDAVGAEALAAALDDPWISAQIRANIGDWVSLSRSSPKLPKLLLGRKQLLVGTPPDEATFIKAVEGVWAPLKE